MTNIEIRPASPEDALLIARLAREIWWHAYVDIIPHAQIEYMLADRYAYARLCDDMADPEKWIDMAFADEQCIGFAACEICAGEYKLDKLYVHPAWQQQGVGGALIRHVTERARKLTYPGMTLAVNKHNEKAIAAYMKLGFTVREARETDIGHGFVMDDYILELRIA
ncbi:MAG: GNAT family N-acetyltransferase [Betaproteobacteria bacterium]|nr:GNAT family N-acetyltransferase [Betaproteobacteria bacterium]